MFKTLILQTLYGLSDAQAEFQILACRIKRALAVMRMDVEQSALRARRGRRFFLENRRLSPVLMEDPSERQAAEARSDGADGRIQDSAPVYAPAIPTRMMVGDAGRSCLNIPDFCATERRLIASLCRFSRRTLDILCREVWQGSTNSSRSTARP